jgi:hypothetical protein
LDRQTARADLESLSEENHRTAERRRKFETEETTFYDPQINEKVPAARLEFMAVMVK